MKLVSNMEVQPLIPVQEEHNEKVEGDPYDDDDDVGIEYDDAIIATGYGRFHYLLLIVLGLANGSDAIEILCVSILLPAAQCDLNMDSAQKGWLNAMLFAGMMIGGFIWGNLGDMFGRRNVLIISLLVNGIFGLLSSLCQGYGLFITLRFISGLGVGGSIPLVWAYTAEFQPASKRGRALSIVASFWMIGNIIVALLALAVIPFNLGYVSPEFSFNSWRIFLALCALPSLIIAVVLLWFPESPLFLIMIGKQEEALVVLQNIFAINNQRLPKDYSVHVLSSIGIKVASSETGSLWTRIKSTLFKMMIQTSALFSSTIVRVTVILIIINFAIQFGYYGLWLWFPELFNRLENYYEQHPNDKVSVCELSSFHSNVTVNPCSLPNPVKTTALVETLITSIAPLPANIWTIWHMDKLGRKFFLVLSMVMSGSAAFGIYFVKSSVANLLLSCVFGAVSTMGFNSLDCLGTELFPTHLRSTAIAVTLVAARLGAISGNVVFGHLLDLYCVVPMILVASLLVGGGLLGILLPNTTRATLV